MVNGFEFFFLLMLASFLAFLMLMEQQQALKMLPQNSKLLITIISLVLRKD
jgi:hypothetical protein